MSKNDDMSMEDILASIRKYVSSNGEPSKYDKKLPAQKTASSTTANVIPLKSEEFIELDEIAEEINIPSFGNSALTQSVSFDTSTVSELHSNTVSNFKAAKNVSTNAREATLIKFIKQSADEKIQKWIDENLAQLVEKRIAEIIEKTATDHINALLKDE